MRDFLILLGVILLWLTLNRWVLPWFGIRTCMSGGCAFDRCSTYSPPPADSRDQDGTTPRDERQ
jgi:hypothetical protein